MFRVACSVLRVSEGIIPIRKAIAVLRMGINPRAMEAAQNASNLASEDFAGTVPLTNSGEVSGRRVLVCRKDGQTTETICVNGLHVQRLTRGSMDVTYELVDRCDCRDIRTYLDLRKERGTLDPVATNALADEVFSQIREVWTWDGSDVFLAEPVLGKLLRDVEDSGLHRRTYEVYFPWQGMGSVGRYVLTITETENNVTTISVQPLGQAWLPRQVQVPREKIQAFLNQIAHAERRTKTATDRSNTRNGAERENRRADR